MKKSLLVLLVLFAVIFMVTSFKSFFKKSENISPNILYLTQPVTTFSGKVEKIKGNKITVSQKLTTSQNFTFINQNNLTPFPTPKTKTVIYNVIVSNKTLITRPTSYINYVFENKTPPTTSQMKIEDIKVDQILTIDSLIDLRTLSGNMFEAKSISIPPILNTINGKIISLEGNVLTLMGFTYSNVLASPPALFPTNALEKQYRVAVTSDTEISRLIISLPTQVKPDGTPRPPVTEKLSLSDLKKDMRVTVYTDRDVNENQDLKALRIEPDVQ